jgi:hypothetical protein
MRVGLYNLEPAQENAAEEWSLDICRDLKTLIGKKLAMYVAEEIPTTQVLLFEVDGKNGAEERQITCINEEMIIKELCSKNIPEDLLHPHHLDNCVVHLQDKVTPSTKALWPGASFQNRSY